MVPETFQARWELDASAAEVSALLVDTLGLAEWWPSVFLHGRLVEHGDRSGKDRVVEVVTAGFLPFPARFRIRTTLVEPGASIGVEATGAIEGLGLWTLEPFGARLVVRFRFVGGLSSGPARLLPGLGRRLFRRSYAWAMERGFTSLLLAVWRRRTKDPSAQAWLPCAPRPPFPSRITRSILRVFRAPTSP